MGRGRALPSRVPPSGLGRAPGLQRGRTIGDRAARLFGQPMGGADLVLVGRFVLWIEMAFETDLEVPAEFDRHPGQVRLEDIAAPDRNIHGRSTPSIMSR